MLITCFSPGHFSGIDSFSSHETLIRQVLLLRPHYTGDTEAPRLGTQPEATQVERQTVLVS